MSRHPLAETVEALAGVVDDLLPPTGYRSASVSWTDTAGQLRALTVTVTDTPDTDQ